jgi:hypothetical protein
MDKNKTAEPSIEFDFVVVKIESMADGSPRITLDLAEMNLPEASMLWAAKISSLLLHAKITENKTTSKDKTTHETKYTPEIQIERIGRRRSGNR